MTHTLGGAPPRSTPRTDASSYPNRPVWQRFLTIFDDINATSAPLLGMEKLIRGDLFHGQPCPTDPTGGPGAATKSPPLYAWSWLYPRFGWDYYICHNFDSPW